MPDVRAGYMMIRRLLGLAAIVATFGSLAACSSSGGGGTPGSTDAGGGMDRPTPNDSGGEGGAAATTSIDSVSDAGEGGVDATAAGDSAVEGSSDGGPASGNPNATGCEDLEPTCEGGSVVGTWAIADYCLIGNGTPCDDAGFDDFEFDRSVSSNRLIKLNADGTYSESGGDSVTFTTDIPKACLTNPALPCSTLAATSTETVTDKGTYCADVTGNTVLYDGLSGTYTTQGGILTFVSPSAVAGPYSYCVTSDGTLTVKRTSGAGETYIKAKNQ